jgi:hypothetical protein
MDLEWRPLYDIPTILVLYLGTDQLARVDRHDDGTWSSVVARHLRDGRRHLRADLPTQRAAMKFAERWVRANLQRIRSELPRVESGMGCGRVVWPASNPQDPRWPG